ncbi:S-methyl-5'-thioadenosine phosphorylase [soil metagenome]
MHPVEPHGDLRAEIGVYGGSGLYELLAGAEEHALDTPYGRPSGPVTLGSLGGRRVAFLARHGSGHHLAPHRSNYRANAWAMGSLGVGAVLGPCAAGSLQPQIAPGDVVVCDQLVDRTWGRADTFHDDDGEVQHLSFADPYDDQLRGAAVDACRAEGVTVHERGTVVVIQGPRFATRAESSWYRSAGGSVINMTQCPEAALVAELSIPYATLALVTDYDSGLAGHPDVEPVTQEQVFAAFERNVGVLRRVLVQAIELLPGGLRPS